MQRIAGSYSQKSSPVSQSQYQSPPLAYASVMGYKIPVRCGASLAWGSRGNALLYSSWSSEIPLYYTIHNGTLHWHEQQLALPGRANLVQKGQAVIWNRIEGIYTEIVEQVPRPPICSNSEVGQAIEEYKKLLISAVKSRLQTLESTTRIAVSQSGGLDSCLVAWALKELGVNFIPLVACGSLDDWDYQMATHVLGQWGITPRPVLVATEDMPDLFSEAVLCYESHQFDNLQMAVCNVAIARIAKSLGITAIFNGHAHDDFMGAHGLVQAEYKRLSGTDAERWRDARRNAISGIGMEKMFSSTFRRYGIEVRMPFFDTDLVEWILAQPTSIIPVKAKKPFARIVARKLLPPGEWSRPVYNQRGYINGAGFYEETIRPTIEYHLEAAKQHLAYLKQKDWRAIALLHASNNH